MQSNTTTVDANKQKKKRNSEKYIGKFLGNEGDCTPQNRYKQIKDDGAEKIGINIKLFENETYTTHTHIHIL